MIYFLDNTIIDAISKQQPDSYRVVAKECQDSNGKYWRGIVVFNPTNIKYVKVRHSFITTDTLDELKIWCDLHFLSSNDIHVERCKPQKMQQ